MIVLDTHALIWWVSGDQRLSATAKAAIEQELKCSDGLVVVSAISAWEIAMLVSLDRLVLTMGVDDWLATAQEIDGLRFEPINIAVSIESTRLPGAFHKDPADRMIVALARHLNAPLVTADGKIQAYKHVATVW